LGITRDRAAVAALVDRKETAHPEDGRAMVPTTAAVVVVVAAALLALRTGPEGTTTWALAGVPLRNRVCLELLVAVVAAGQMVLMAARRRSGH
jgi:hypothetical protein